MSSIDLLLLGKTGNGRSALGNAILGWPKFEAKSSLTSVTNTVDLAYTKFKTQTLKVVDGPGVEDTRLDQEGGTKKIAEAVQEAIAVNPRGYHAFLLVVRYGIRFTAEDSGTINFLKSLFGEEFLSHYSILVFTFGDQFEAENGDKTIDQWCREQDGEFKKVFDECQHRVVLFDNAIKDERKQEAQIEKLLKVVKNLPNQGQRYTDANFELARAARKKGIEEFKKLAEPDGVTKEINVFLQNLEEIKKTAKSEKKVQFFKELLSRLNEVTLSYRDVDQGTGDLEDIEKCLNFVTMSRNESTHVPQVGAQNTREKGDKEEDIISQICQALQKQNDHIKIVIAKQMESEEGRKKIETKLFKMLQDQAAWIGKEEKLLSDLKRQKQASREKIDELETKIKYEKEQQGCAVL